MEVFDKMKNSLSAPMIGYLMLGKTFRNKVTPRVVRHCVRHYSKNSILFKPIPFDASKILTKEINVQAKNYCTSQTERTNLMNFSVALTPDPFKSLRILFHWFFTMRKLEDGFKMQEFIENSKCALVVVSKLLSESRFDKLDGLLTSECKAEVERNAKALKPSQRMALAINAEDIFNVFPYDLKIIQDGERKFVQILIVYYACKNFPEIVQKPPKLRFMEDSVVLFTVYNCQFIKEITNSSDDQWTINAINVYKAHEDAQNRKKQLN